MLSQRETFYNFSTCVSESVLSRIHVGLNCRRVPTDGGIAEGEARSAPAGVQRCEALNYSGPLRTKASLKANGASVQRPN